MFPTMMDMIVIDWILLIIGIILTVFGGLGVFLFALIEKRLDYFFALITGIGLVFFSLTGILVTSR